MNNPSSPDRPAFVWDKKKKYTWWSVTAYNDEIELLENKKKYPSFVKKVVGGREQCPTTGNIHFQATIQCNKTVRFAAIKQWLPTAHIEATRTVFGSCMYSMKEETAVGEKKIRLAENTYYKHSDILDMVMQEVYKVYPTKEELVEYLSTGKDHANKLIVDLFTEHFGNLYIQDSNLMNLFSNDLLTKWKLFFFKIYSRAISITHGQQPGQESDSEPEP